MKMEYKKSFFLFTNLTYGMSFIEVFSSLANEYNISYSFTIVLSGKHFNINYFEFLFGLQAYRKLKSRITYIKDLKRELNNPHLKIWMIDDINSKNLIKKIPVNAHGIISGFNQIFKRELISSFASLVNFHPSILPYYKGPVPSFWCIKNKETHSGFSLHKVTTKVDSGEIYYQEKIKIMGDDEPQTLDKKIAQIASTVMVNYMILLMNDKKLPIKLIDPETVYLQKINYLSFPR